MVGDKHIHFEQTKAIAIEVFGDADVAETIAVADSSVDRAHRAGFNRGYWRHFDPFGWLPGRRDARQSWAEYLFGLAVTTGDRRYLGLGLHSLQDKAMHGFIPWEGRPWVRQKPSWRDNPRTNPHGAQLAESSGREYLKRFCRYSALHDCRPDPKLGSKL